ncbi:methionyl-tRNA formyltransferase family protein [Penicillium riverlandense]|uniref:methionyl-tRNA formyltransferase family protein n=1 Tax=Penicillium riverlandense TaxID=1903569 RepID=UPI002547EF3F|nr:methionyl-tRNA formyltransferase family protein [Penicillium riverlandense]KAJ5818372.1 methionyl-tRNA formyltransferase family protein [Penicillium riverlandense]
MFLLRGPALGLCSRHSNSRLYSTKAYDPLRILFCGSDDFSIASLKALHAYHLKQPDRIASIDVVCRPGKRVGRGLKKIREVPIKAAASDLSLPIHEIDTFTGWTPPTSVNLIVAVSFGLFVPSRLLNSAKYGGLNVHPSLLPDFRGPAPLHHTLLAGRNKTGVSLQTLHLKHFDHGTILSQTPAPGFDVPNPESCTVPELIDVVAPKGAQLLVDGIKEGLFVPPVVDAGWRAAQGSHDLIHAAKIKPEDRHIDWTNWSLVNINRRSRVLGPLWSKALVTSHPSDNTQPSFQQKRVILTEMEEVDPPKGCGSFSLVPGLPFVGGGHPVEPRKGKALYVFTSDGKVMRINRMKVEGEQDAEGLRAAIKARMFGDRTFLSEGMEFVPFRNPLV